ncbi:MAG: hypothetical protein CME29_07800 [Gemmatimonadetes bacterium]|nr:hypothetical protein [Gemmatimonadota bacterium]|tara:strand:+ start:150 stop:611 length:462 start_codon:yes stop_codon:yes gene_type:complete
MKFLCIACDTVMDFAERQIPGDGTLAAVFECGSCDREVAMLTNPMETQLVSSMGVKIGGREVPAQPMELARTSMEGGSEDVFDPTDEPVQDQTAHPLRVTWTSEAVGRLDNVPSFVRGMVKRIYTDWAQQNGVNEMNPKIMDRARSELGLEGM